MLLTVKEAADALGVHTQRVYQMVHAGKLAAVRRYGRFLIDPEAVQTARGSRERDEEPGPEWVTTTAAAAMLGVSLTAVLHHINRGRLRTTRPLYRFFVWREDVEALAAARKTSAG